jgi:hypothetical protein
LQHAVDRHAGRYDGLAVDVDRRDRRRCEGVPGLVRSGRERRGERDDDRRAVRDGEHLKAQLLFRLALGLVSVLRAALRAQRDERHENADADSESIHGRKPPG